MLSRRGETMVPVSWRASAPQTPVLCRTPQGVRALLHVYIMLIEPLFFGPYYAFVRDDVHSFAFALFLVIVVRTCICKHALQAASPEHVLRSMHVLSYKLSFSLCAASKAAVRLCAQTQQDAGASPRQACQSALS